MADIARGPSDGLITYEELALAARNRGMPLEALRYDITPTGLHYLLIHFDIPALDPETFLLRVGGAVQRARTLTLEQLRSYPARTEVVTMECAGNGRARLRPRPLSQPWLYEAIGTARWTGCSLADVLADSEIAPDAVELVFRGADRGFTADVEHDYERSLPISDAMRPEVLLAYEMNGEPLQPQHGAPLRLLVPGWYGMTSVKWLTDITAVTEPFTGFEQSVAYHFKEDADDPGTPVTRIRVRALMIPPGIPDFFTRARIVDAGPVTLEGRAWCGTSPVVRVEVGVDGTWLDATLDDPVGAHAWRRWTATWDARAGEHTLTCRATDAEGNTQPAQQPWNYQGMGNNLEQQIAVRVR